MTEEPPSPALELGEAVALLHAWIDELAHREGTRALLIKGPVLQRQGLRPPNRVSGDVDVLIAPGDFDRFCDAMEARGWVAKYGRHGDPLIPVSEINLHSATFRHPSWPCEVDAHFRFAGLLADSDVTFDALWTRRTTERIAGRDVTTCDPLGNALIAAAHGMRDLRHEQHQHELAYLVDQLDGRLSAEERRELAALAAAVGASDTLGPFLDDLGCPRLGASDPARLRDWRLRTGTGGQPGTMWLVQLARTPVRRWPRPVLRALWPPAGFFLTRDELDPSDPHALRHARLRRLARVCATLPGAIAALWRNRRYVR